MKLPVYVDLKDKLIGDYRDKFIYVEQYGDMHMVDEDKMAEKMMDLMDIMLQAQEGGTQVSYVVGKNVDDFCKNFFSDVTVLDSLKGIAKKICVWAWLIIVCELLFIISDVKEGFDFFTYKTDVSGYVCGIAVAFFGMLIADIIGIILAKQKKYSGKLWRNINTVFGLLAFIYMIFAIIYFKFEISILCWPVVLFTGIYLVVYYICVFTNRYKKTGSIKKIENSYMTSFSGMIKEEIENTDYSQDLSVVKTFSRNYTKKNEKLIKKGESKLTTEEFFERQNKYKSFSMPFGFLCGILMAVLLEVTNGSFDDSNFTEIFVFVLICVGVLYLLFRFSSKIKKTVMKERKQILEKCKEKGVEIDEYYEMLLAEKEIENKDTL